VPRPGAALLVAVLSGLVCLLLGLAKSPPLVIVNFVLPAAVVDLAASLVPRLATRPLPCAVTATLASASRGLSAAAVDALVGMEEELLWRHVAVTTLAGVAFGVVGALLVPPVVRRLQANRLVSTE